MTVKEELLKYLISLGMHNTQANEVIEKIIANDKSDIKFDYENDYPAAVITLLKINCKEIGLELINEKWPEAWFKPMFLD